MALDSELSELVRLLPEGTRAGKLADWRHGHDDDVFRLPLRVGTALTHSHHVALTRRGSEEPSYAIVVRDAAEDTLRASPQFRADEAPDLAELYVLVREQVHKADGFDAVLRAVRGLAGAAANP
jgi:hypothetical protein